MSFLANVVSGVGSALLPLASVLLLEELTYGGLVRLLVGPKSVAWKSRESHYREGERRCSH